MKEILSELLSESRKRIKNPIISSFIFSWVIFNWKGISYFIFSKDEIQNKIECIRFEYSSICLYFIFPFLFAVLFTVALPHVWLFIEEVMKPNKVSRAKVKSHIREMENINKKDEYIAERELDFARTGKKQIEDYTFEIEELKVSNEQSILESNDYKEKNRTLLLKIKTLEQDLINLNIQKVQLKSDLTSSNDKLTHSVNETTLLSSKYENSVNSLKSAELNNSKLQKLISELKKENDLKIKEGFDKTQNIFSLQSYVINDLELLNESRRKPKVVKILREIESVAKLTESVVFTDLFDVVLGNMDKSNNNIITYEEYSFIHYVNDKIRLTGLGRVALKVLFEGYYF